MKTRIAIPLLLIVASASFLFGAKTAEKKLKWPYLPKKWSEPAKITELELACVKARFRTTEPIVIESEDFPRKPMIFIDRIKGVPKNKLVKITVDVRPADALKNKKGNFDIKGKRKRSQVVRSLVLASRKARTIFQDKITKRGFPCDITITHKGKIIMRGERAIFN